MKLSSSASSLRQMIERAIEDHELTRSEYDMIIHHAMEGGIDNQEKALLNQLQEMIADKSIKMVP